MVISYPICIESQRYSRNQFIFNFAFVLSQPDTIDVPSYKSVIRKLAHLMRGLEEQSQWLSDDESSPEMGKVYNLCETLMGDLNNYAECMIPIDDINTLNVKLFPTLPNPAKVKAWHVPLFAVRIETLMDDNWDLTMQRVIPFINGINSVKQIAALADADLKLTIKCVRHLLYYGCVLLLDIFRFDAIYAPTAEFSNMIATNLEMQAECARYVNTAFEPSRVDNATASAEAVGSFKSGSVGANIAGPRDEDIWPRTTDDDIVDGVSIVLLFARLSQGLTVREWYLQNSTLLANIDVRRFITFGVIKGFLYRVHRYAFQTNQVSSSDKRDTDHYKSKHRQRLPLAWFLDGTHSFDEICTYFEISEKELLKRLSDHHLGEVIVLCR